MASAPTRPALRERFERRRDEVIETAAAIFAERGYAGAAIEDLSKATGLTVGGLYHYIGNKENLLSEILRRLMDPLLERAVEIEDSPAPASERLRDLIRVWVTHVAGHRDHMLVFNQERHLLERDPNRWEEIRTSRREFERVLGSLIAAAAADAGPLRADGESVGAHPATGADLEVLELALLGMVNHTATWIRIPGRLTPEQIADGYAAIILSSLRPSDA